jgi:hypothetical protein
MEIAPAFRNIGLGLAAGLVGTLVMTLGQRAEMALTGREGSLAPAKAAEAATGIQIEDEAREQRLSTAVHFGYGTALGVGLAALRDVPEPARTLAYFAAAQGAGMALFEALDLDGKPSEWNARAAAIDVGHHLVYATAAGLAFLAAQRLIADR